jgi:hypothetical protein
VGCEQGLVSACGKLARFASDPAEKLHWMQAACDAGAALGDDPHECTEMFREVESPKASAELRRWASELLDRACVAQKQPGSVCWRALKPKAPSYLRARAVKVSAALEACSWQDCPWRHELFRRDTPHYDAARAARELPLLERELERPRGSEPWQFRLELGALVAVDGAGTSDPEAARLRELLSKRCHAASQGDRRKGVGEFEGACWFYIHAIGAGYGPKANTAASLVAAEALCAEDQGLCGALGNCWTDETTCAGRVDHVRAAAAYEKACTRQRALEPGKERSAFRDCREADAERKKTDRP